MTVRLALVFSAAILAPTLAYSAPAPSVDGYKGALSQSISRVEPQPATATGETPCEPSEGCIAVGRTRGIDLVMGTQGVATAAQRIVKAKSQGRPRPAVAARDHVSADDLKLHFLRGSAELTPDGEANIAKFAVALNDTKFTGRAFLIVGHTDATGTEERNQGLSEARAVAVKDALVRKGVDPARLETKGLGTREPAARDPNAAANRRVEVRAAG